MIITILISSLFLLYKISMYILDYIKKDIIHPPGANLAHLQTFNVFL